MIHPSPGPSTGVIPLPGNFPQALRIAGDPDWKIAR
jgi:hypothetical protein